MLAFLLLQVSLLFLPTNSPAVCKCAEVARVFSVAGVPGASVVSVCLCCSCCHAMSCYVLAFLSFAGAQTLLASMLLLA
jgi:hypothetical protein